MPTNLTNTTIKDTYEQLLHVDGGPAAVEKVVYSASGVATALKVGTTSASVDNIQFNGNSIIATNLNGDITLVPNGTGEVNIPRVNFTEVEVARTSLGLGTLAVQDADDVNITGGSIADVSFTGSFTGITLIESVSFQTVNGGDGLSLENTSLVADGTSTNIDISITPKGTGAVTTPKLEVTGSFGYAVGAGGSVTQSTDKSTSVTINKLSGQITTAASELARDTTVTFVVNNSLVGANDVVVTCITSGGTLGIYELDIDAVTAGAFTLSLRNHSAAVDYSEAVVINFVVIKGTIT